MKRLPLALTLLSLVCGALAFQVRAQDSRPAEPSGQAAPPAQSLAFLAGDWESRSPKESFRAHYGDPEGGLVLGVSKSIQGGRAVFFELEVFRAEGQVLVLQPYPGGKAAASFRATKLAKNSVTFANPKNEFPKEITYACPSKDRLEITLTGDGREQRFALERLSR